MRDWNWRYLYIMYFKLWPHQTGQLVGTGTVPRAEWGLTCSSARWSVVWGCPLLCRWSRQCFLTSRPHPVVLRWSWEPLRNKNHKMTDESISHRTVNAGRSWNKRRRAFLRSVCMWSHIVWISCGYRGFLPHFQMCTHSWAALGKWALPSTFLAE